MAEYSRIRVSVCGMAIFSRSPAGADFVFDSSVVSRHISRSRCDKRYSIKESSMKPRRARACASTVKYNHTHRHASECSAYGLSATLFPRYSPHMIPGGSLSPLTTLTLYIRATHTHYRRASCRQGRPQRGEPKQTLSCVSAVCSAKADVAAEVGALVWPLPASCRRRLLIAHTSART